MKIPYELVEPYASQLADAAALAETAEERIAFWDYYEAYLAECGWSEEDFDKELFDRLSENWETKSN